MSEKTFLKDNYQLYWHLRCSTIACVHVVYVCAYVSEMVYCVHMLYPVLIIIFGQWLSPYGGYSFVYQCQIWYHVADTYVPVQ